MEVYAQIDLHCIVPDTEPFILFGVEIRTKFSKTIVPKRFSDFYKLQHRLALFVRSKVNKKKKLHHLLPRLPGSLQQVQVFDTSGIEARKAQLTEYLKQLLRLFQPKYYSDAYP